MDKKLRRIAVDLTPLLPGGENGGAKLMTIELIRNLSRIAADCKFLLLTSEKNHEELAFLDSGNVRRILVSGGKGKFFKIRKGLRPLLAMLPAPVKIKLKSLYFFIACMVQGKNHFSRLKTDLLFCPFTAPFFHASNMPTVSVIYDLQFFHYPQFFTFEERCERDRHFKEACRLASRLICISNYVREAVLKQAEISSDRVHAVYIRLSSRLPEKTSQKSEEILARLNLAAYSFLLYPANFWEHKNHRMLLTAFGIYLARNPKSDMKLLCTGHPCLHMEALENAAKGMKLDERVVFPGYLSTEEYAVLLRSCKAVIYPSLYEGFGMPIVEAMAYGKPVLCSNVTSLPEVAGEAALYFDPKRPQTIVEAISVLEKDEKLVAQLVERGRQRAAQFSSAEQMAREYWKVFLEATSFTERAT